MDNPLIDAFLDGFTGAGLYEKLSPPGRPDQFKAVMRAGICGFVAAITVMFGIGFSAIQNHGVWFCALCVLEPIAVVWRIVRRRRRDREG